MGALIFTSLILMGLSVLTNTKFETITFLGSIASAIATVIICFYTVKSVAEVIKSNTETAKNNHRRDIKESFEKKFTLLLQEHNKYLEKIIESKNELYDISYLQSLPGYESYSIIRGLAKFATLDDYKFCFHNNQIMIELFLIRNKTKNTYYYAPFFEFSNHHDLEVMNESHNVYYSGESTYAYFLRKNELLQVENFANVIENKQLNTLVKSLVRTKGEEAKKIILKNNNVSKNLLSPYMRIVYHLLKCSSENTIDKHGMKSYTNIVRSIIPYDILMLVAINSMFFYKSFYETKNELRRWSDIFNISGDSGYKEIFNDYHKYYELLVKCDFFEHLNMNFSQVIPKTNNLRINADLSFLTYISLDCGKKSYGSGRNKFSLMISGDTWFSALKVYKLFNDEVTNFSTDVLLLLFYFEDNTVEKNKLELMDEFINSSKSGHCTGKLINKNLNMAFAENSFILKENNRFILSIDFFNLYTKGKLPKIF